MVRLAYLWLFSKSLSIENCTWYTLTICYDDKKENNNEAG